MTLDRCPFSIFCSRSTPPTLSLSRAGIGQGVILFKHCFFLIVEPREWDSVCIVLSFFFVCNLATKIITELYFTSNIKAFVL